MSLHILFPTLLPSHKQRPKAVSSFDKHSPTSWLISLRPSSPLISRTSIHAWNRQWSCALREQQHLNKWGKEHGWFTQQPKQSRCVRHFKTWWSHDSPQMGGFIKPSSLQGGKCLHLHKEASWSTECNREDLTLGRPWIAPSTQIRPTVQQVLRSQKSDNWPLADMGI